MASKPGSAPKGHGLLVVQREISKFYRSIVEKEEQARAQGDEEYSPSQEELQTHISLHIAATKALLGGDPKLNSAYESCDKFLHTIQKAFEEEERAKHAMAANSLSATVPEGWSNPWGGDEESVTGPNDTSTSPFSGGGSGTLGLNNAAGGSNGHPEQHRPRGSNFYPNGRRPQDEFSQNLSQLRIASQGGQQRPRNAGAGHYDSLCGL